ncbi:hypothetical protein HS125_18835 [bacterium]|nr:hypothetical protein [bacterium]
MNARGEKETRSRRSPGAAYWWVVVGLAAGGAFLLSACESGRQARGPRELPAPERVYTLVSRAGGSDEVRVRCAGAFSARIRGLERRRVHCVWEFRRGTREPLRFDPAAVRLEDPDGRLFGPSEVRVNGRVDQALDLSSAGSALVDIFFDLGADYPLSRLGSIMLSWQLDLGDEARPFTTRFYQEPRSRRYGAAPSHWGLGVGYSTGGRGRSHWGGGVSHGVWW